MTRSAVRGSALALAVVLVIAGAVVGGRAWTTRPRGEPAAVEFGAAELGPRLTGATVLGFGEATHGNAEFQRLRQQLIARLPEFRAVVMEEDFGTVARANGFIQGGPGTAVETARSLGFAINRTAEVADLLQWLREHNDPLPAADRIELVGMDVQRYQASKELALAGLARTDPKAAERLRDQLAGLTDDASPTTEQREPLLSTLDRLVQTLAADDHTADDHGADPAVRTAQQAAVALRQGVKLDTASGRDYGRMRAEIMFANLSRTVTEQRERGNRHTLLFGHTGHLDKVSAAFSYDDLGALATRQWGDGYRVIGTDFVRSTFSSGQQDQRWQVHMTNRTPLRGMFVGTEVGLLDFATAGAANRAVLDRPVRMASAGENFRQWQAWIPWLSSVRMVPSRSYDALIMVQQGTPVTAL